MRVGDLCLVESNGLLRQEPVEVAEAVIIGAIDPPELLLVVGCAPGKLTDFIRVVKSTGEICWVRIELISLAT